MKLNPIKMKTVLALTQLSSGQSATIFEITGGWGIRQRLQQVGLHIGDRITLRRSAVMGGPLLLTADQMDIALSRGMANHILVQVAGQS